MRICLEITNRCKSSLKSKVNCRSNSCQETQMKWTTLEIKAYVSEEILNWHCLSLSLNADFCIHFYWLSQLRQANHRKIILSSALCQFKISWNTPALRSLRRTTHFNTLISDFLPLTIIIFGVYRIYTVCDTRNQGLRVSILRIITCNSLHNDKLICLVS